MPKVYVSRAGVKLEEALSHYNVDVQDKICMDVGAATGGFTDCLLQHGADRVYTVETGYGVLDWKLRQDSRVVVMERTNILYELGVPEKMDLIAVDTSWTRLRLALPAASRFLKERGIILALIKPQYEVDKKDVRKGIVPSGILPVAVDKVRQELISLGFDVSEAFESPITGEGGNHEFWVRIITDEKRV